MKIKPCTPHHLMICLALLTIIFTTPLAAQQQDEEAYFNPQAMQYQTRAYTPAIRTIQLLNNTDSALLMPIIPLGSSQRLTLRFDELVNDAKSYSYTFIHCSSDWQPTDLWPTEYLEGYTEATLADFDYSFNTTTPYVHYWVSFPNRDIRFTKSGNYIIKVYPDDDPDRPVVTARFMVAEQRVAIDARVTRATVVKHMFTHQEVRFTLRHPAFQLVDAARNVKVVISQNGRWDNALRNLKPRGITTGALDYNYDDGRNLFFAGNEYRAFEMKNLSINGYRVHHMEYPNDLPNIWLWEDKPRLFSEYLYDADINGRYFIKTDLETSSSMTEADYVTTHFFFPYKAPMPDGTFYIQGALSGDEFTNRYKMQYDFERHGYHAELLLKQGYYNYQYLFVQNGQHTGDPTYVEGSFADAENDYFILVYYRAPGDLYDRLVGTEMVNSLRRR